MKYIYKESNVQSYFQNLKLIGSHAENEQAYLDNLTISYTLSMRVCVCVCNSYIVLQTKLYVHFRADTHSPVHCNSDVLNLHIQYCLALNTHIPRHSLHALTITINNLSNGACQEYT